MESKGPRFFFFVAQFAHFGVSHFTIWPCLTRRMTGKIHELPLNPNGDFGCFWLEALPGCFGGGSRYIPVIYGCFLKWWYPISHPKMIIFSRKTNGCWVPPFQETPHMLWSSSTHDLVTPLAFLCLVCEIFEAKIAGMAFFWAQWALQVWVGIYVQWES